MNDTECYSEMCDEAVGLLMTYRCNLDCKYCYIHTKRNKEMSLEMAMSLLEPFLLKDEGCIDIIFMGGETLLAFDVIRPLVEWVEHGTWKRKYRFFGSTNGTLLNDDIRNWLIIHRQTITLGLSYDGLPSAQVNNRGHNDIDIDFFIKTWPHQPIQMTLNTDTVSQMADGVIYLLEKGATVHPNVAFEEKDWTEDKIVEYGRQLHRLALYYNKHEGLPLISQFQHDLVEYADGIDNHKPQVEVCGAGNGFQVFDTDGKIYPCHILSPLVLDGAKLDRIKEGIIGETSDFSDSMCKECPYTSVCPTCIACNYLYRGGLAKRDITHYKIMKMEVRVMIKKEVMRLNSKDVLTPKDATEVDAIIKLLKWQNISQ